MAFFQRILSTQRRAAFIGFICLNFWFAPQNIFSENPPMTANPSEQNDLAMLQIERMLDDGLDDNFKPISESSKNLSAVNKERIYLRYKKKDQVLGCLFNIFPGYGIGSFYQGDTRGGLYSLAFTGVGIGFYIAGIAQATTSNAGEPEFNGRAEMYLTTGAIILVVGFVYSAVRAYNYPDSYNRKLGDALNLPFIGFNFYKRGSFGHGRQGNLNSHHEEIYYFSADGRI